MNRRVDGTGSWTVMKCTEIHSGRAFWLAAGPPATSTSSMPPTPFRSIRFHCWTGPAANARYGGTYGWDVGPIIPDDPDIWSHQPWEYHQELQYHSAQWSAQLRNSLQQGPVPEGDQCQIPECTHQGTGDQKPGQKPKFTQRIIFTCGRERAGMWHTT